MAASLKDWDRRTSCDLVLVGDLFPGRSGTDWTTAHGPSLPNTQWLFVSANDIREQTQIINPEPNDKALF